MSLNLGTLFLRVSLSGTGRLSAFEKQLSRTQRSVISLTRGFGGLSTAIAAAFTVDALAGVADTATETSNRIVLATKSLEGFKEAQKGVYEIARSTATEVDSIALLFQRMTQGTESLGMKQEEVLSLTETVSKAVSLGGSNAQEASGAIRQFTQALGGDFKAASQEMNSIIEQTPGLAGTISKGLGITTSQLKVLTKEQVLTTEMVINSLKKMANEVDESYSNVDFSIGKSMLKIKTGLTDSIREIDRTFGVSRAISDWAERVSKSLTGSNFQQSLSVFIVQWENGISRIVDAGGALLDMIAGTFGKSVPSELGDSLKNTFKDLPNSIATLFAIINTEITYWVDRLTLFFKSIPEKIAAVIDQIGFNIEQKLKRYSDKTKDLLKRMGVTVNEGSEGANPRARAAAKRKADADKASEENKKVILTLEERMEELDRVRLANLTRILDNQRNSKKQAEEEYEVRKKMADDILAKKFGNQKTEVETPAVLQDALNKRTGGEKEAIKDMFPISEQIPEWMQELQDFQATVQSTLGDELYNILDGNFDNIGDSFKSMLKRMAADALAANVMGAFSSGKGEGFLSGIGGMLGFGGGKPKGLAGGGPLQIGKPTWVGEQGPELVIPKSGGTVIPNHALGGGSSTQIFNISTPNPETFISAKGKMASQARSMMGV